MSTSAGSKSVQLGDVLAGQYLVESVLGEGGMGLVYGVVDVANGGAPYAMKVVTNTKEPEHITRFFREGRATMRLKSEHVVQVFDIGSLTQVVSKVHGSSGPNHSQSEDGVPYMVMERLVGTTLKAQAERAPLSEQLVANLIIQACEGLAHAHAIGIVHRDVKPSNMFVLDGGSRLKVLDFGISRMASFEDWERTATVTESNALLGSPHYVSPEQLQNASAVDARADVWSLGVSMYYALSGKFPFGGSSLAELLVAVMSYAPVPLATRAPHVSATMNAVVSKCLERSLDRRFQSVAELARALAPMASPEWAALVPRIDALLVNAPLPTPRSSSASVAPAKTPAATTDRTLTVNEPIPALNSVIEPPTLSVSIINTDQLLAPAASATVASSAKSRNRLVGIGILVATAITIAAVGGVVIRKRTAEIPNDFPLPPVVTSAAAAPSPTPTPSSSASSEAVDEPATAADDTQLMLIADAPITKIVRPTSPRRVSLEDGKASITVNPFRGDLPVEVELANGGRARGVAHAGGEKTIHLVPVKGWRKIGGGGRTPAGSSSSELQKSPY